MPYFSIARRNHNNSIRHLRIIGKLCPRLNYLQIWQQITPLARQDQLMKENKIKVIRFSLCINTILILIAKINNDKSPKTPLFAFLTHLFIQPSFEFLRILSLLYHATIQ